MGQAVQFPDQNEAFAAQADRLARRRKLAEQLVTNAMQGDGGQGYHGGRVYAVGNQLGNVAQTVAGTVLGNRLDVEQQDLARREQQAAQSVIQRLGTPGMKEQFGPAPEGQDAMPQQPLSPEEEDARRLGVIGEGMAIPSLRQVLAAQIGQELDYPRQRETEKAKAAIEANRLNAQDERQAKLFVQQQELLDKRIAGQKDLRQTPSVVIHQGGGGSRSGATSAPDGKPLSSQQEKAALELGGNRTSLQMLSDTFKDDYAGDLRSTLQRKFGEVAGGAAPQATQDMTRWWANQAMFDELPQRHELFGATLTAGEKAAWAAAAINPSLSPKTIRERMATRQRIYDDVEHRMRGSVEAGGKSTKQFDAAVGKKPTPQAGSGRTLVSSKAEFDTLPVGAKWETPDGRKGTK